MIDIDVTDFIKAAENLGVAGDQIPFAMSVALNQALKDTREYLTKVTWPSSITQRNPTFIRAALQTKFSDKYNLEGSIYDALDRGHLKEHAEGGTHAARGSNLAIPSRNVKKTAHGVSSSQKPLRLTRSFKAKGRIYQQTGRGKSRRLKVMYLLKPSVPVPKDVPFYTDFNREVQSGLQKYLPHAMIKAMATRRAR
jgi:hypothetical protein